MKYISYLILLIFVGFTSCKNTIDLYPQSNLNTGTYYKTIEEVQAGLTGCYNGLQAPMAFEWQLTELRSDNTKQGVAASTSSTNRDLSDLDMFIPLTIHSAIYSYWLTTYNNIRNTNIVLDRLGVKYDPTSGSLSLLPIDIQISDVIRKQLAGEALFIRAHHYFNLVRLYGGVFLIHTPISATEAKSINRSSVDDIYKLIISDLTTANTYLSGVKFASILAANIGKANQWSSKALLGKVYLTLNKKTEAATLLQDVVNNSGYSLQSNYANVFSITTEMNSEILFTVRYKAGGLGLGSPFGNNFAALNSGSTIINGSGAGLNTPTSEFADSTYTSKDLRKAASVAVFGTGTAARTYVKKYLNPVVITGDGESDWPVIRFSDVQLMLAEAQGNTAQSLTLINAVRVRAGLTALTNITTVAAFEKALADERRLELAFENHRYFDLLRFNTTLTSIKFESVMKNHFAKEYASHYASYPAPILTLPALQATVTAQRSLLPIPQREIDTNPALNIAQNPGY